MCCKNVKYSKICNSPTQQNYANSYLLHISNTDSTAMSTTAKIIYFIVCTQSQMINKMYYALVL